MIFFTNKIFIDFMGLRKFTGYFSMILCLISILFLLIKGLTLGLEFQGGLKMELHFSHSVKLDDLRKKLVNSNIKNFKLQCYGDKQNVLLKMSNAEIQYEDEIYNKLKTIFNDGKIVSSEYVGSEIGSQLIDKGSLAMFVGILFMIIYISIRFEYKLAVSSAIALSHDILIILGIFSCFNIEFNLATLAAVLAVLGYSINDTVVVFDRVRENFKKTNKTSAITVMNISINQTLSRTIVTSILTLLVIIPLLIIGGESLFGFSLSLALGIIIGTYSSIYIAGSLAVEMGLSKIDIIKKRIEIEEKP